jgi:hypothetical protein
LDTREAIRAEELESIRKELVLEADRWKYQKPEYSLGLMFASYFIQKKLSK